MPPAKINQPVLASDMPWDGEDKACHRLVFLCPQRRRQDSHLGFRRGCASGPDKPDGPVVALLNYAESTDGIHFTKPDPARVAYDEKTAEIGKLWNSTASSVWIDPKAPPSHRYKTQAKYFKHDRGYRRDGLSAARPTATTGHSYIGEDIGDCDTQTIAFWDEAIQRYVMYTRDNPGGDTPFRAGAWSAVWSPTICCTGKKKSM